ncbi:sugar ABC transporter substrate-binding protein [Streptomyces sp. NPDC057717]|uniref:sugar ABC transporter substrate-binding protein n=1 Tax=Streptomyces sp. NPDC057717 TaxID=3346224 RepID=UPI0036981910
MSDFANISRHRSRWLAAAASAMACSLVAGCGAGTADRGSTGATGQVNIAFLGYSASNGYTRSSFEAAQKAAAKYGAKVTFFDGKFDGATQTTQARDAIASGKYQALEILPNNSRQLVPVVKEALAKGIKVAAIDYAIGPDPAVADKPGIDGITVQIADNMAEGGQAQGKMAVNLCKGISPCNAMILVGSKASDFDVIKLKEIKKVISQHPNIKVVSEAEASFDEVKAERITRDVLQAHPDLNIIISTGDQHCFGAQRAARAAGKQFSATTQKGGGKIACLGWGAARESVDQILAGHWPSSITLVPESFGAKAAEHLIKSVRNPKTLPLITTQSQLSPIGRVATKETLEEHPEFKGEWNK